MFNSKFISIQDKPFYRGYFGLETHRIHGIGYKNLTKTDIKTICTLH